MDTQEKLRLHKTQKIVRRILYSRFLFICAFILIQIAFFILFSMRLQSYVQYFLGGRVLLSVAFLIYIVNSKGRNEFKLVWLLPIMVLPVFGTLLFLYFKINFGARKKIDKRLDSYKDETAKYLFDKKSDSEVLDSFPKIGDISTYLINEGKYPPYKNTATKYYPSGESCFPDMISALKSAKKFIFIEFFIIESGTMLSQILEILVEKAHEGVDVKILYDGLGSLSVSSRWNTNYLKAQGISAEVFMPFTPVFDARQNTRDHRKNFIVDGKVCFTGGINISDEYINRSHPRFDYWKDSMIRIEGKAVRSFTAMFLHLFYLQRNSKNRKDDDFSSYLESEYPVMETDGAVIPYGSGAYIGTNTNIGEDIYVYILSKAHDYVHIMSPYLLINNAFMEALIFAAKRGVDVELIIPKNYDHFFTFCIGRRYILPLIKNGIKVYQYIPGFIHSKVFVSDGNRATVGSVNLDYRSFYHHFENGAFLYNSSTIKDIEYDFQVTKAASQEITMEVYKQIPFRVRAIGWLLKIIAPLL